MSALSSSAEVFFTITNINDHSPVFGQEAYSVSLKENATIGTTVLKINVSDADSPVLKFGILSGNTGSAFSIEEQSGTQLSWSRICVVYFPVYVLRFFPFSITSILILIF